MQKVPTFGDIAEIEALNAKTYFWQPERYVFQAPKIAEASSQIEKELEEQKVRVVREIHQHNDDRMGDNPVIVRELARGEQGVRGDPGPRGVEGRQGVEGPRAARPSSCSAQLGSSHRFHGAASEGAGEGARGGTEPRAPERAGTYQGGDGEAAEHL